MGCEYGTHELPRDMYNYGCISETLYLYLYLYLYRFTVFSEPFLSRAIFCKGSQSSQEITDVAGTKMSRQICILIDVFIFRKLRSLHNIRK